MRISVLGEILLLMACLYMPLAIGGPLHRFTLRDFVSLQWANNDVQISPDGREVAFVRSTFDIHANLTRSSVWVVNSDGSELREVAGSAGDASQPYWSPAGDELLYVVHDHKRWDISVWNPRTGVHQLLAVVAQAPDEFAWGPNGSRVAFAMLVPPSEPRSLAHVAAAPQSAYDWNKYANVITRLDFRWDERGYLPAGHMHLFVLPASGGVPKQVTFGDHDDAAGMFGERGGMTWSRNGMDLIFAANRGRHAAYRPLHSEIYEVPAAGGPVEALTHDNGPNGSPAVSPNGKEIAYTGYDNHGRYHVLYHLTNLYVMNRNGANPRLVVKNLDRSVSNPAWGERGKRLYFEYPNHGIARLAYVSLSTGTVTTIAKTPIGIMVLPYTRTGVSISPATKKFAFAISTPDHPTSVGLGVMHGDRATITRLTHPDKSLLGNIEFGKLQRFYFTSSKDGQKIEGWVLTPPDFNAHNKYPLILQIHGGPTMSWGPMFSAESQYFAGLGYVVLYMNQRISTSYGLKFANLPNGIYPGAGYDDLMSGVSALIKRGYIDPNRLFVTGGSAGGFSTAWIVGHTHRFRAAAAFKPVINWYTMALDSDIGYFVVEQMGDPWTHLNYYMKYSPISYVGNVTTPTLVMHGMLDYRVPMADPLQFYRALKIRHVPTALVLIPGVGHYVSAKPGATAARLSDVAGWFACYGGVRVGQHTCPEQDASGVERVGSVGAHTQTQKRGGRRTRAKPVLLKTCPEACGGSGN